MYAKGRTEADAGRAPACLPLSVAALSERGSRRANEDACGHVTTPAGSCFVVSDGAGGHAGGEVASRLIVRSILDAFQQGGAFDRTFLARCLTDADRELRFVRGGNERLAQMSGTVAVVLLDPLGERAIWGHLGDTRVCHFRRGSLVSVTRDHSVAQRLIDAGLATPERPVVARNLLYGAMGGDEDTTPTLLDGAVATEDGDAFLVCTDGFWSAVDAQAMQRALRLARTPDDWLSDMHRRLAKVQDSDNYTALAVWVGAPEEITVIDAEVD